jgi:hypothetical protein
VQLLNALLDRDAKRLFGDEDARMERYPQLDVDSACTVLDKIVGLTTITRMKLGNTDLPQLDKKSSAELSKLLQASQLS